MQTFQLSASPGHLIRRLHQFSTSLWANIVSDQITSPQFGILNFLADHPGCDQTTLGSSVFLDRASTTEIVGRMTKKGLVCRVKDPKDMRRWKLTLTELGYHTYEELAPLSLVQNNCLIEALSKESQVQFLGYLQEILNVDPSLRVTEQVRPEPKAESSISHKEATSAVMD